MRPRIHVSPEVPAPPLALFAQALQVLPLHRTTTGINTSAPSDRHHPTSEGSRQPGSSPFDIRPASLIRLPLRCGPRFDNALRFHLLKIIRASAPARWPSESASSR